jgi:hypothetical protein
MPVLQSTRITKMQALEKGPILKIAQPLKYFKYDLDDQ